MPGNTPNFGFEYPLDTDNLSDGAQSIEDFATLVDTTFVDLKGGTTDQLLAKNSNTDMDFKWVALPSVPANYPVPGAGYYLSNWHQNPYLTRTTAAVPLATTFLYPLFFGKTVTIDRIAFECTTASAATTCRLGLYDSNGTGGAPSTLIADFGTVATATTGVKELTVSQSVTAGLKFVAFSGSSTSVSYRALATPTNALDRTQFAFPDDTTTLFGSSGGEVWRISQSYGTYPNPASPTLGAWLNNPPILGVRIA
jgi:hypothetical protein